MTAGRWQVGRRVVSTFHKGLSHRRFHDDQSTSTTLNLGARMSIDSSSTNVSNRKAMRILETLVFLMLLPAGPSRWYVLPNHLLLLYYINHKRVPINISLNLNISNISILLQINKLDSTHWHNETRPCVNTNNSNEIGDNYIVNKKITSSLS